MSDRAPSPSSAPAACPKCDHEHHEGRGCMHGVRLDGKVVMCGCGAAASPPSPAPTPSETKLQAVETHALQVREGLGRSSHAIVVANAEALIRDVCWLLTALRSSASALAEAERELSETTLLLQKVTAALNTALDDETQALFHYQAGYTAGYSHGRRQEPQRGEESARAFVAPRAALAPGHPEVDR